MFSQIVFDAAIVIPFGRSQGMDNRFNKVKIVRRVGVSETVSAILFLSRRLSTDAFEAGLGIN